MERVYARKCAVKEMPLEEAQAFMEAHHRQGAVTTAVEVRSLALLYEREVVMVAQFCAPRTPLKQRKYTVELLRLCGKSETQVVGGASKLITAYKRKYKPFDFFTYQDTTGEASRVYEHCGMTLVEEHKKKTYLVAPKKTLATAGKKEKLSLAYAVRYGPDRILGTKLGEVYREDGRRKSNRDLFLEELGWHLEETTGDRVYEWVDPTRHHYVYKITATDSDKYYYGVRRIATEKATIEECLKDSYWGSGGPKFQRWRQRHEGHLRKEVLALYPRRGEASAKEKEVVGTAWRDDPACLNSLPGGGGRPPRALPLFSLRTCAVHGESKYRGERCLRCQAERVITTKTCPIHGATSFMGSRCQRCTAVAAVTTAVCPKHGEGTFQHGHCLSCQSEKSYSRRGCAVHGLTTFHGATCLSCQAEATKAMKECPHHGLTLHRGATCCKCQQASTVALGDCPLHGRTKFRGDHCYKCQVPPSTLEECPVHGRTLFKRGGCCKCRTASMTTVEVCEKHGEGKFQWGRCCACRAEAFRARRRASEG